MNTCPKCNRTELNFIDHDFIERFGMCELCERDERPERDDIADTQPVAEWVEDEHGT